ncbi:hypothetical protein PG988_016015 [Apiospora saccharicola]
MQSLPIEVVDRIVWFLPGGPDGELPLQPGRRPQIAPYAAISTRFLEAVQRRVWRRLQITNEDLDDCARYLRGRRLVHLQQLYFTIILPPIDQQPRRTPPPFERAADTEAVSQAFGLQVRRFFDMLDSEPWREKAATSLQLGFHDVTHRSARKRRGPFLDIAHLFTNAGQEDLNRFGIDWYRQLRARLTLPQSNELPMLHSVHRLSFQIWERRPEAGVQVEIASRMPGLVSLDLAVDGTELRYPGVLRKDRHSLADALTRYSEQTKDVAHATLHFCMQEGDLPNLDEYTIAMPNHVYPLAYDALSASLRVWSQRLTSFSVSGVFDEALFWPQAGEGEDAATAALPEWHNLQTLDVQLELCTPSGGWYFLDKDDAGSSDSGKPPRDPASDPENMPPVFADDDDDKDGPAAGDGDEDDDGGADLFGRRTPRAPEFYYKVPNPTEGNEGTFAPLKIRNVPNRATMEQLLAAWARALARMPSLRSARLNFRIHVPYNDIGETDPREWDVVYEAPGHRHPKGEARVCGSQMTPAERAERRLIFVCAGGWRPGRETMDLLRAVGADSWPGTPMVVLAVSERMEIVR